MNTHPPHAFRYVIPIQVAVLVAYVWYLTAGLWTALPKASGANLYDQLAAAFRQGHLYLDRVPAPDLLALQNPYSIQQRRDVSTYIGDATLYEGRYYLYWGPVPAMAVVMLRSVGYRGIIGDAHLVLAAVAGVFLVLSSMLTIVWKRHFADVPRWALLAGVFLLGLGSPLTWTLGNPLIYEAALASSAFFFAAGVLCTYLAMEQPAPKGGLLAVAGLSWALAAGCQFTQIVAVGAALGLATIWLVLARRSGRGVPRPFITLVGLWGPAVLMLVALGWYNHARFGSITEFGYRYQLAVVNLNEHYNEIFQPIFALPNLYNYLLNPFQLAGRFPFMFPKYGSTMQDAPFRIPRLYYTEAITGLLYTAPIIIYALLPLVRPIRRLLERDRRSWLRDFLDAPLGLPGCTVFLALVPNLGVLLFFYYAAPRYLLPVIPLVMATAVLGFWQSIRYLSRRPVLLKLNTIAAGMLASATVLVSSLLAISSSQDHFFTGNPALIERINSILFP